MNEKKARVFKSSATTISNKTTNLLILLADGKALEAPMMTQIGSGVPVPSKSHWKTITKTLPEWLKFTVGPKRRVSSLLTADLQRLQTYQHVGKLLPWATVCALWMWWNLFSVPLGSRWHQPTCQSELTDAAGFLKFFPPVLIFTGTTAAWEQKAHRRGVKEPKQKVPSINSAPIDNSTICSKCRQLLNFSCGKWKLSRTFHLLVK